MAGTRFFQWTFGAGTVGVWHSSSRPPSLAVDGACGKQQCGAARAGLPLSATGHQAWRRPVRCARLLAKRPQPPQCLMRHSPAPLLSPEAVPRPHHGRPSPPHPLPGLAGSPGTTRKVGAPLLLQGVSPLVPHLRHWGWGSALNIKSAHLAWMLKGFPVLRRNV